MSSLGVRLTKIVYQLTPGCASLTQPLSLKKRGGKAACGLRGELLRIHINIFNPCRVAVCHRIFTPDYIRSYSH